MNHQETPQVGILCSRCVLPDTFPGIRFDEHGVCFYCRKFEAGKKGVEEERARYRQKFINLLNQFRELNQPKKPNEPKQPNKPSFDVLMAYSGGKDSSYTLKLLKKDYGLRVLAITFNNGFISPSAVRNIHRVTESLEINHRMVSPDAKILHKAFAKSITENLYPIKALERASSICNTCMNIAKSILLKQAIEMGIPLIAYGWSPGQAPLQSSVMKWNLSMMRQTQSLINNTIQKLIGDGLNEFMIEERHYDLFEQKSKIFNGAFIYNINPLSLGEYNEEQIFKEIEKIGWKAPADTDSNSTNCLLNGFANQVHQKKYGYHPYAFEIAGLVRGGYMTREEGLKKLSTPPDEKIIQEVKNKLGLLIK